jgi:hypothetical protein
MTEQNTQTRTEDMIQHIRLLDNALSLLDNALSMNFYHAAKTWLNHVLDDMEILEAEIEDMKVLEAKDMYMYILDR